MVEFALWFITFLFIVQVIVLLYLLTSKKRRLHIESEIAIYYNEWFPSFHTYLTGNSDSQPRCNCPANIRVKVVEKILNHLIDYEYEKINDEKLRETAYLYLGTPYRLFLGKGSWSQRVNTLYFIEEFNLRELKNDVWKHFYQLKTVDEEYRQALRTLGSLHDERLIPVLLQERRLSQRMIKELLRRLPSPVIHELMGAMENKTERLPHQLQLGIVSFCGELKTDDFLPFIEKRLSFPNREIRLKALRAIADIGSCYDSDSIYSFFSSGSWEERMLAAKVSGNLHLTKYRGELHTLAGDREWWVRFAALEALRQLPEGPNLLEEVLEHHEDKYARDMASRLLSMEVSHS